MKKNSIIVNVARGGVINDLALIQALKEKNMVLELMFLKMNQRLMKVFMNLIM